MKHPLSRLRAFPLQGDDSLAAGRPLLAVSGESGLSHKPCEGSQL